VILSVEEVIQATGGRLLQGEKNALFEGVSTDSRTIRAGDLFIALKGDRFDGHLFALEALKKEAGGIVVEEESAGGFRWNGFRPKAVIVVKDTLRALGDLARERRRKHRIPVLAVTGSNGKTTTKEMISACLETTLPILKTQGNLNNLIGLPLTLLKLTGSEKAVVLEMGMNVPGEIRRLTEIAEPDVGLITNIQQAHLEGMGSLDKLQEEKGELFKKMRSDGTILVNRDDPRVVRLAREFPGDKMTFGVNGAADVMARDVQLRGAVGTSFTLVLGGEETVITLPVLGRHFVPHALSAVAAAKVLGIDPGKIRVALERFHPYSMRMEIFSLEGGATLINDAYNANPASMEAAMETLAESKGKGRAVAVLGDMLELGEFEEEAHRRLGEKIGALSIDFVLCLGEKASLVVESAIRKGMRPERAKVLESHAEAVSFLNRIIQKGDWILVKGSRRMAMERVAEGLKHILKEKKQDV
jgi:UDP-N-acetylmuramoyl-tripeptide--D-alanyl-D-alanine ligase